MLTKQRSIERLDRLDESEMGLIPKPVRLSLRDGEFRLHAGTVIVADPAAMSEARMLSSRLSNATGFPCSLGGSIEGTASVIELRIDPSLSSLGKEGYRFDASPSRVTLRAAGTGGLFYAVQTLLQLMPVRIFSRKPVAGCDWVLPCVEIEDYPRFAWRGMMLDVARHFMPLEFITKFIDLMALHKLNVLHLHLNDDQGWRIEIKQYPKLTSVGAFREKTLLGRAAHSPVDAGFDESTEQFDDTPHGDFYTQDQIRSLIEYAAARHITVVPEIEMPGHAQAAIAAYPELGCTDKKLDVSPRWGVHADIYNPSEQTISFLQNVLVEVMDMFPSEFIHVGGDEAVKIQWKASSEIQARIKELGLRDEHEMQSYFIGRMDEFLTGHGRRLIGWDEILEGGLAGNAIVMSWRGEAGGLTAAQARHDVIMAPYQHTYFDFSESADTEREPVAMEGTLPLEKVYQYEPIPIDLPREYARYVLGAQGQLWTEYIGDPGHAEYMTFPRLCALAEVIWTTGEHKSYSEFLDRLARHEARLDLLGVNHRPVDAQM